MLVAQGLRKSYRTREVVRDFGLTLDAGEVVGLLGPNGAGKTTCFYMIVGLVPADAGADRARRPRHHRRSDVHARPARRRLPAAGTLGVPQAVSVADNIRLVLELRADLDDAGRERELDSADGRTADRPRRRPDGRQPVRRRAPPRRNRPRAGRQAAPDAARRALRRRRPDLGRRDPAHRPPPEIARDRGPDHRPQRPRDPWASATARISSTKAACSRRGRRTRCWRTPTSAASTWAKLSACRSVASGRRFPPARVGRFDMKPRLQTSLGQHLVMTPQLRQAIRLLQLSTAELEIEIASAVESNPLLDWEEAAPQEPAPRRRPRTATAPTHDDAPPARRLRPGTATSPGTNASAPPTATTTRSPNKSPNPKRCRTTCCGSCT